MPSKNRHEQPFAQLNFQRRKMIDQFIFKVSKKVPASA